VVYSRYIGLTIILFSSHPLVYQTHSHHPSFLKSYTRTAISVSIPPSSISTSTSTCLFITSTLSCCTIHSFIHHCQFKAVSQHLATTLSLHNTSHFSVACIIWVPIFIKSRYETERDQKTGETLGYLEVHRFFNKISSSLFLGFTEGKGGACSP
jgi:hypothetical protein